MLCAPSEVGWMQRVQQIDTGDSQLDATMIDAVQPRKESSDGGDAEAMLV